MSYSRQNVMERDCNHGCKSKVHGDILTSVLTKRDVSDVELCAYLRWLCTECGCTSDSVGRTCLHIAASRGRKKLVDWLLRSKGALINAKDLESGYTALHRSIFYGQLHVAVSLMKQGINLFLMDHDDLTAIDHAMKDRLYHVQYNLTYPCEVYVWGSNDNYTLGSHTSKPQPELLDSFRKQYTNVSIKQVCLRKFHCVMVASDGSVFTCGHGPGGRLGVGSEKTMLVPTQIRFHTSANIIPICKQAAIGRDHSLFLMENGTLWTCGLNANRVLGLATLPEKVLIPKQLPEFNAILKGTCAARFHSVAWSSTNVYTWGTNAGQLGHKESDQSVIITPKQVTALYSKDCIIIDVSASDGATVVVTKRGDIYALHEYQCRRIASRQLNVIKIAVIGGNLNLKLDKNIITERTTEELKVLALTNTGNILLWQESTLQLTRCIFTLHRSIFVTDVALNKNSILLVTRDGEAFHGEIKPKKKKKTDSSHHLSCIKSGMKSAFHQFLDKDDCEILKLKRLPNIHRAVAIYSDLKGRNFAVLQTDPKAFILDVPIEAASNIQTHMMTLLEESDEMDTVHDVIFKVQDKLFPAHRFIVAYNSEPLDSIIRSTQGPTPIVELININDKIFYQILKFLYTKTCDLLYIGPCPSDLQEIYSKTLKKNSEELESHGIDNNISAFEYYKYKSKIKIKHSEKIPQIRDPVRLLQEAAKRFDIKDLYNSLDLLTYDNGYIRSKGKGNKSIVRKEVKFDRTMFPNLCDVWIKGKNGNEIPAHKCILAGRLDYFNNLFALRWNEDSNRNVISMPLPKNVLELVIEFLYTDYAPSITNCDDLDFICNVLVIADQLFIERLKTLCEIALVNLITLRNIIEVTNFADLYNASQLKKSCFEFICLNLPSLLENRGLELLNDDILEDLSKFYCELNSLMSKRIITPYSDAPSDDIVKSINEVYGFKEDNDESDYEIEKRNKRTSVKKKHRVRRISSSEKCRNRNESVCSNISEKEVNETDSGNIDKSFDVNQSSDEWTKILRSQEKHKLVRARLRANAILKEELYETFSEKLTILEPKALFLTNDSLTKSDVSLSPVSSPIDYHFPELKTSHKTHDISVELTKSPPKHDTFKAKMHKVSQKQRKKLQMEINMKSVTDQLDHLNNKQMKTVWRERNESNSNILTDVLEVETNVSSKAKKESLSENSKNPWQKLETPSPGNTIDAKTKFSDIIADEKKQKENWSKMVTKPLLLTQIEDKAIEDLKRFYNVENSFDEHLTVDRVKSTAIVALPTWVHMSSKSVK